MLYSQLHCHDGFDLIPFSYEDVGSQARLVALARAHEHMSNAGGWRGKLLDHDTRSRPGGNPVANG